MPIRWLIMLGVIGRHIIDGEAFLFVCNTAAGITKVVRLVTVEKHRGCDTLSYSAWSIGRLERISGNRLLITFTEKVAERGSVLLSRRKIKAKHETVELLVSFEFLLKRVDGAGGYSRRIEDS
jgi:hypothetical protein